MDPGGRIQVRKAVNVTTHIAEADGVDGGHVNRGAVAALGAADRRLQIGVVIDQPLAALVVDLPKSRQL